MSRTGKKKSTLSATVWWCSTADLIVVPLWARIGWLQLISNDDLVDGALNGAWFLDCLRSLSTVTLFDLVVVAGSFLGWLPNLIFKFVH